MREIYEIVPENNVILDRVRYKVWKKNIDLTLFQKVFSWNCPEYIGSFPTREKAREIIEQLKKEKMEVVE